MHGATPHGRVPRMFARMPLAAAAPAAAVSFGLTRLLPFEGREELFPPTKLSGRGERLHHCNPLVVAQCDPTVLELLPHFWSEPRFATRGYTRLRFVGRSGNLLVHVLRQGLGEEKRWKKTRKMLRRDQMKQRNQRRMERRRRTKRKVIC